MKARMSTRTAALIARLIPPHLPPRTGQTFTLAIHRRPLGGRPFPLRFPPFLCGMDPSYFRFRFDLGFLAALIIPTILSICKKLSPSRFRNFGFGGGARRLR